MYFGLTLFNEAPQILIYVSAGTAGPIVVAVLRDIASQTKE